MNEMNALESATRLCVQAREWREGRRPMMSHMEADIRILLDAAGGMQWICSRNVDIEPETWNRAGEMDSWPETTRFHMEYSGESIWIDLSDLETLIGGVTVG